MLAVLTVLSASTSSRPFGLSTELRVAVSRLSCYTQVMPLLNGFKPFSLLLTGAPGWLCDTVLSQLGETLPALTRVRCLVQTGTPEEAVKAWRRAHPSVTEIVGGDLREAASLEKACENLRGGVIVHAAAIFHADKLSDFDAVNRDGTKTLATLAKKAGVKRFVFISSLAAQGAARSKLELLTEDEPCRPLNRYGASKLEAERATMKLHEPGVFDVVIVRPGSFYGLPVPPHHVALFKDLQHGRARLVGGGNFARSWTHIDELAAGVITCLHHPAAAGQTLNLCDARVRTQLELFEAAAHALGVAPSFRSVPAFAATWARFYSRLGERFDKYYKKCHLLSDQNCHTGASSAKAQKLIGYDARSDAVEGLQREVEWCRERGIVDGAER